jgi:hypothetical protein
MIHIYSALIWLALGICAVICAAFWIVEYGKKQLKREREYENLYSEISKMIYEYYVCEANYKYISDWLNRLGNLEWKNKEKTEMLILNFRKKYTKEWTISIIDKKFKKTG